MNLRDVNLQYALTRLTETSTWLSINAGLIGLGVTIPSQTFHKIEIIGIAISTMLGVILPQISSPVTTDVGQAKKDAGIPLTGVPPIIMADSPEKPL